MRSLPGDFSRDSSIASKRILLNSWTSCCCNSCEVQKTKLQKVQMPRRTNVMIRTNKPQSKSPSVFNPLLVHQVWKDGSDTHWHEPRCLSSQNYWWDQSWTHFADRATKAVQTASAVEGVSSFVRFFPKRISHLKADETQTLFQTKTATKNICLVLQFTTWNEGYRWSQLLPILRGDALLPVALHHWRALAYTQIRWQLWSVFRVCSLSMTSRKWTNDLGRSMASRVCFSRASCESQTRRLP